jgi:Protein of unknown function (DUF3137)
VPAWFWSAACLGIVVLLPVLRVGWWFARRRRRGQAFRRRASALRLAGFAEDPFGLDKLGMPLFDKRDGQLLFTNVVVGEWQDLPFKAAELSFLIERSGVVRRRRLVERARYAVLVAELDLRLSMPMTVIAPESAATKAKAAFGFHDIQFESGQFNDRFHVRSRDRRFAYDLIDARMMEHLLGLDNPDLRCELLGPRLLVAVPRSRKDVILELVVPLFGVARAVAERIPRVVWDRYGLAAPAPAGGR